MSQKAWGRLISLLFGVAVALAILLTYCLIGRQSAVSEPVDVIIIERSK